LKDDGRSVKGRNRTADPGGKRRRERHVWATEGPSLATSRKRKDLLFEKSRKVQDLETLARRRRGKITKQKESETASSRWAPRRGKSEGETSSSEKPVRERVPRRRIRREEKRGKQYKRGKASSRGTSATRVNGFTGDRASGRGRRGGSPVRKKRNTG